MAMTGPTASLPLASPAPVDDTDPDEAPGWLSTAIRRDPVRAVAIALIVIQIAWRAKVGAGGYLSFDDFELAIKATENGLTFDYLASQFNNHLMPAGLLYMWAVTKWIGYAYWPYLLLMLAGQAVLSYSFYRLLRQVVNAQWGLLVPLSVFLFTTLNVEVTSWWVFGMLMLPMQLSMVWAMGAQIKYARTGRKKHLISLAAAFLFGLAFGEKAALIIPLLYGLTACLLVKGSPGRSIWRALVRFWPSWAVLVGLLVPYLAVYQVHAGTGLRRPDSVDQVMTFVGQLIGQTLIPGLVGGPWEWFGPLPSPGPVRVTLSIIALVAVIAFTIWRRPSAGRAWLLVLMYTVLATALIAATRMGLGLSGIAGLVPRYASDITVVAAFGLGVAMFGMRGAPDRAAPRQIPVLATPSGVIAKGVAVAAAVAVFAVGIVVSTNGYARHWAQQPGRDYLAVTQAELAKAPEGTVFFDRGVPGNVMVGIAFPYNLQSRFFSPAERKPVFVTEGENVSVFDDSGKIRPAWVEGLKIVPGTEPDCGYRIKGGGPAVTMPLENNAFDWFWTVRMGYISNGRSAVEVRLDGRLIADFTAEPGLHPYYFLVQGGGRNVEIKVLEPGVELCTNDFRIGNLVPWML